MEELEFKNIGKIAILVEFNDGKAHQVIASKENKKIFLELLAQCEGALNLSKEIEPIEILLKDGKE